MAEDSSFDEVKRDGLAVGAVAMANGSAVEGSGDLATLGMQTLANLAGRGAERRSRKALAAVDEASAASASDYVTLEERAGADDQRIELTVRALAAAARADSETKVRALGPALATVW